MNYGLALMQKGLLDEAIDLYTRALDTGYGHHPYLHLNLAIALAAKGMDARAEASFRTGLSDGPGYPATHYYFPPGSISRAAANKPYGTPIGPWS